MARLSGLQRDVLALYRRCLRAIHQKPPAARRHFEQFARREFERHRAAVDRRDFATVEFLLRKGRRQLHLYAAPTITDIVVAA